MPYETVRLLSPAGGAKKEDTQDTQEDTQDTQEDTQDTQEDTRSYSSLGTRSNSSTQTNLHSLGDLPGLRNKRAPKCEQQWKL